MKTILASDKKMLKQATKIILFISFSQMLITAVGFLDVYMISNYSTNDFAAIGIGAEIWFIFQAPAFAVSTLFAIFYSQYQKNKKNFNELVKINIIFSSTLCLLISLLMVLVGKYIVQLFFINDDYNAIDSQNIQDLIYRYLQILAIGNVFMTIGQHMINPIIIIKNPKHSVYIALVALASNALFNYVFIYSLDLGTIGAGISTSISYAFELVYAVIITWKVKSMFSGLLNLFTIDKQVLKSFFKKIGIAISSIIMFWTFIATSLIMNIEYGSKTMQSLSIAYSISGIMFSMMAGIRKTTNIIIGKSLGNSDFEKAKNDSNKLLLLMVSFALFLSAIAIGLAFFVPQLTIKESEYAQKAKWTIVIFAASFLGYVLQTYFSSIVESSGKSLVASIFNYWIPLWLQVPLIVFMGPNFANLKFEYMFLVQSLAIYIAPVILFIYKRKNKWLINLNKEIVELEQSK